MQGNKNFQSRIIPKCSKGQTKAKPKTEADLNDWERKAVDFVMQDDPDNNQERSREKYVNELLTRKSGMIAKHVIQSYKNHLDQARGNPQEAAQQETGWNR